MARSYGPRFDRDGVTQHAKVANVGDYGILTTLWTRKVATRGTITCELLRNSLGPGRRLVRLIAEYRDAGKLTTDVVMVGSAEEEARTVARLEQRIIEAERRPAELAGASEQPGS
jgi:hypothetical protein